MKKSLRSLFLLFSFLIAACNQNTSKEKLLAAIPDPKSLGETYISNPDRVLSPETVSELNSKLSSLDQEGTAHIDVVFVKTIGDLVPKEVAHELFNSWKVGSKETNNGLLVLVVEDQKRIEFETGYGLEGALPDVICYRIQQEYMVPYARQNDYNSAVKNGVDAVISHLKSGSMPVPDTAATAPEAVAESPVEVPQAFTAPADNYETKEPGDTLSLIMAGIYFIAVIVIGNLLVKKWAFKVPLILLLFFVPVVFIYRLNLEHPVSWFNVRGLLIVYLFLLVYTHVHIFLLAWVSAAAFKKGSQHEQYMKRRDTFASMEWLTKIFTLPFLWLFWKKHQDKLEALRYENINCDHCGKPMTLTNEEKDDEFLSKGQAKEEQIFSIDYDVWVCSACGLNKILDYNNLKSKAKKCTNCHFTTAVFSRRKTIEPATTSSEGYGFSYYLCANCGKETHEQYIIPKISTSSSSSSSSSGSSSGGSSSSSSGGSSGGGGAGSSW